MRWKTANEDGRFETINEQPIAGAGTVDAPQNYEYVDRDIRPDTAYYYYVESISLAGEREVISPVFRAPPKPVVE